MEMEGFLGSRAVVAVNVAVVVVVEVMVNRNRLVVDIWFDFLSVGRRSGCGIDMGR